MSVWNKTLTISVVSLCYLTPASAEWVEWIADLGIEAERIDNINNSYFADDEQSDTRITPQLVLGRYFQLSDFNRISLAAQVRATRHQEYDGLDQNHLGASISYRHKFGLGRERPWLLGTLSYTLAGGENDLRDTGSSEFSLAVGKRLSERLDMGLHYGHTEQSGTNSDVFTLHRDHLDLSANYLLTPSLLGTLQLGYHDGWYNASVSSENMDRVLYYSPNMDYVEDKAFKDNDGNPYNTYALEGSGYRVAIRMSYGLSRHSALNLGLQQQRLDAKDTHYSYSSNLFAISYNYRY